MEHERSGRATECNVRASGSSTHVRPRDVCWVRSQADEDGEGDAGRQPERGTGKKPENCTGDIADEWDNCPVCAAEHEPDRCSAFGPEEDQAGKSRPPIEVLSICLK